MYIEKLHFRPCIIYIQLIQSVKHIISWNVSLHVTVLSWSSISL